MLGFIVEQLELRRGFVPALFQRICKLVAPGEVDGCERSGDGFIAGLLGFLRLTQLCARIVLAEQRALGVAAIAAQ